MLASADTLAQMEEKEQRKMLALEEKEDWKGREKEAEGGGTKTKS